MEDAQANTSVLVVDVHLSDIFQLDIYHYLVLLVTTSTLEMELMIIAIIASIGGIVRLSFHIIS